MAQRIIKAAIAVVSVLLVFSLLALGWTFLRSYVIKSDPAYVVVPDNYIKESLSESDTTESDTTESDTTESDTTESDTTESDTTESDMTESDTTESDTTETDTTESDTTESDTTESDTTETDTTEADTTESDTTEDTYVYKSAGVAERKHTVKLAPQTVSTEVSTGDTAVYASLMTLGTDGEENKPFNVTNMFPGDSETRYYCVCVTYRKSATLYFEIKIREGYEKLAEVLKFKVEQISDDRLIHDDVVTDMYFTDATELKSSGKTTVDVYYKITAYLDTSVGNEYMEKELIADFKWWIEEDDRDIPVIRPTEESSEDTTSDTSEIDTGEDDTSVDTSDSESESQITETDTTDTSESDTTETDTTESRDTTDVTEPEETTSSQGHDHAPQTGDRVGTTVRIAVWAVVCAFLLLLLLVLLMLRKDDEYEEI